MGPGSCVTLTTLVRGHATANESLLDVGRSATAAAAAVSVAAAGPWGQREFFELLRLDQFFASRVESFDERFHFELHFVIHSELLSVLLAKVTSARTNQVLGGCGDAAGVIDRFDSFSASGSR